MVRTRLMQRRVRLPGVPSSKHSEYSEKNPGQLQPEHPRQLHQPATHRIAKALATLLQPLPRLSHLGSCPRGLLSQPDSGSLPFSRSDRSPSRSFALSLFCRYGRGRIRRSRRINGCYQRLGRRTGPHTKRTTESDRIHTQKCSPSHRTGESLRPQTGNAAELRCIQPRKTHRRCQSKRGPENEECSLDSGWVLCGGSRLFSLEPQPLTARRVAGAPPRRGLGRPPHRRRALLISRVFFIIESRCSLRSHGRILLEVST